MEQWANGTLVTLQAGEYRATFASVGATLVSLTKSGKHLVVPFDVETIPDAYQGKLLVPWPNRIGGGVYVWAGEQHQLPINEVSTGTAAHGLLVWDDWEIVGQGPTTVSFAASVFPRPGYPFSLSVQATYSLNEEGGLVCEVMAQNVGPAAAPYGIAGHPYLTCNLRKLDECLLLVPASSYLPVDDNLLPTGEVPVDGTDYDFRTARFVGGTSIDNAFGQLPPEEWFVDLTDPDSELTVRLTSDAKWLQLYTAERLGRPGVAVEPMTCPPNAFRSGVDVITLEPGHATSFTYGIRVL